MIRAAQVRKPRHFHQLIEAGGVDVDPRIGRRGAGVRDRLRRLQGGRGWPVASAQTTVLARKTEPFVDFMRLF